MTCAPRNLLPTGGRFSPRRKGSVLFVVASVSLWIASGCHVAHQQASTETSTTIPQAESSPLRQAGHRITACRPLTRRETPAPQRKKARRLPPIVEPDSIVRTASSEREYDERPRPSVENVSESPLLPGYNEPLTRRSGMSRFGHQLETDFEDFLARLHDDSVGIFNTHNATILGFALAGSLGVRYGLDDDVRNNTRRHPNRWGDGSRSIGRIGDPQYQVAALGLMYGYCRLSDDGRFNDITGSLFSAVTLTGLSTLSIKAIANTDRPSKDWNGGQFGFPSYHSASTFAAAAVIDEYYGPRAGIPAYLVAGLVGWSRIDERDHDLSDVVFGAALGILIGKSVSGRQLRGDGRVHLLPYTHPEGGSGLMLEIAY